MHLRGKSDYMHVIKNLIYASVIDRKCCSVKVLKIKDQGRYKFVISEVHLADSICGEKNQIICMLFILINASKDTAD